MKTNLKEFLKPEAVVMALSKLQEIVKGKPLGKAEHNYGTGGDNARYGAVCLTPDDKLRLYNNNHPCHAFMRYYNHPLVVFNQYGHRPTFIEEKADRAFFDFITSDTGPWKSFGNRKISETPDGACMSDFIFSSGWVWSDLSYPANLQHSFLVAARMPAEWPKFINYWHRLVQKGCNEALSFVFLDLFLQMKDDKSKFRINRSVNKYDWPIDVITSTEDYVKNFCQGKVENLIHAYSDNVSYKPVNRIFGKNDLNPADPSVYPNTLFLLYHQRFGASLEDCKEYYAKRGTTSSDLASFKYETHWYVSEDEMIQIINLEQKRLKI